MADAQAAYESETAADYRVRGLAASSHLWIFIWATKIELLIPVAIALPLLLLLAKGSKSYPIRQHALSALNAQISWLIYLAVFLVFSVASLGLATVPMVIVLGVLALVLLLSSLGGIVLALTGRKDYHYPLTLDLLGCNN